MNYLTICGAATQKSAENIAQKLRATASDIQDLTDFDKLIPAFWSSQAHSSFVAGASQAETLHRYETESCVILHIGDPPDQAAMERLAARQDVRAQDIAAYVHANDVFAACIMFKDSGTTYAFGDIFGLLRWRIAKGPDAVMLSTHDILLIGSGIASPDSDRVTACSIEQVGWSVCGYSAFSSVQSLPHAHYAKIELNACSIEPYTPLKGPSEQEALQDEVLAYLARRLEGVSHVTAELTAGFDSRAGLAALLSMFPADKITAFSEGPEEAVDVTVAKEIAARSGIQFEHKQIQPPTADVFAKLWVRLALETNGHIDLTTIVSSTNLHTPDAGHARLCGDGAEVFTGYYYPYTPFQKLRSTPDVDGLAAMHKRIVGKVSDPSMIEPIQKRWEESFRFCRSLAQNDYGALDAVLGVERTGVWNQKIYATQNADRISPLLSRRASTGSIGRGGFSGWENELHMGLVKKYLPKAVTIPINQRARVQDHGSDFSSKLAFDLRVLRGKLTDRLEKKLGLAKRELQDDRVDTLTNLIAQSSVENELCRCAIERAIGSLTDHDPRTYVASNTAHASTRLGLEMLTEIANRVYKPA